MATESIVTTVGPTPISTPQKAGVLLRAVDAATGQTLPATFFLNGVQQQAFSTLTVGASYVAQAQCQGYSSASKSFIVSGSSASGVVIPLPSVAGTVAIQVQFNPAQSGIQWSLDSGALAATNPSGVSQMPGVSPGAHVIQVPETSEFAAASQSITVGSCRSFTITLVRKTASGDIPTSANKKTIYDPSSDPLNMPGLVQDVSEDTYDNSAYQGYFTSAQARLYIGSLFIDQMNTLQYALQQNNVTVFGYCSEFVDAYARGRSLVQGQIVLNYVHQGYLYAALKQYAKLGQPASASAPDTGTAIAKVTEKSRAIAAQGPSPANQELSNLAAQKLTDLLRASSPADIQKAQSLLRAAGAPYNPYSNPLYAHQVFDMRLEIGDGPQRTVRLFESVELGANEQILDQSGQVLGESYGFTARRLR